MIDHYQNVDIFGQRSKLNQTNFDVVMAEIYNFIFHLPTERKKQVLDYLGYCYIDNFMTPSSPSSITQGNQTTTISSNSPITSSHEFIMANYDPVKATFFSTFFTFGNPTNFIYFFTRTNSNSTTLVENTGITNQVAWVPTSFLGTGSVEVTNEISTTGVINIGDVFHK
ncbi:unnamed protein product [Ambrosiozyma monospora]|uniref:Unnamed protein product n=1 Tax=Ambrosiozyma monospora TaxID=43982 RepID=A0ACB5T173_AMBMO|nr:unnamed protein product [Ambrosiozyma monospora]